MDVGSRGLPPSKAAVCRGEASMVIATLRRLFLPPCSPIFPTQLFFSAQKSCVVVVVVIFHFLEHLNANMMYFCNSQLSFILKMSAPQL